MSAPQKIGKRPLLIASATLLAVSVTTLTAPAAFAAPKPSGSPTATTGPATKPTATPPARMSTLGGERLGQPGTQVDLASGVPVLPKDLTARSWIVSDAESGEVLAAHNAHWRLPPASTLKMLFADTVLPRFPRSETYKVAPADLAGIGAGSSVVGIKANRTYSVHDLWLGVFLRSGNDAVHVLSAMNGGVAATVKDMQAHADQLQALDTHVVSPDGYDADGQVSSAYDLSLFARSGLQKKDFREYCSTVRAKFPTGSTQPGKGKGSGKAVTEYDEIQNTNRLLSGDTDVPVYQGIAGVKNGNTTHAGATFTGVAERGGKVLLVTVMNPAKPEHNEVYKETAKLFDWGFQAAGKVRPVGTLVPPKNAVTASPDASASASAAPSAAPSDTPGTAGTAGAVPVGAAVEGGHRGAGTALAVAGGLLVLLVGAVFLVNRRWPLPDLLRRRSRP
ncbi:D-alanyl-D-alanine carboxypeptidase family protein [Streptomyces sp. LaPpAH-108]|uniref:D-alanyl-D-alanine carboxypeptidase family protein n=1 Tax=Streptomyces sp. LaPpAH-108 TaxID=1155714 RepID=UPI0003A166E3|nr:D-alanyl-D-alanine carboxypeptidase family protein [Streptomyces sp. LaPpAH-108]